MAITPALAFAEPARLETETIAFGTLKPAPLVTRSSGRSIFIVGGLVGALVDMSEGKDIARKNDIRDPAVDISRSLATTLADRRGGVLLETPLDFGDMKPPEVAKAAGQARYVINVVTRQQDMWWYSTKWNRYFITYQAQMNVLDGLTGAILAYDHCKWKTAKASAQTRDDLLKDGARGLKDELSAAGATCLAQFERKLEPLWLRAPLTAESAPAPAPIAAPSPVKGVFQAALTTLVPPREPVEAATATHNQPSPPPPPKPPEPVLARVEAAPAPPPRIAPDRWPEREPVTLDPGLPTYVEYPYARPGEAPPPRFRRPAYRYAGRDADGYLVWPGKRP